MQSPDPDIWRWSPNPLEHFINMLSTATMCRETVQLGTVPRFFEAGCGPGTKLYVAREYFDLIADGWDVIPEYVEYARQELNVNAELHDLDNEDPPWERYDIVYISRPFKDDAKERAWEAKVQERMRPGAVLMASFAGVKPYSWRWLYREPWRLVAVKPVTGEKDHTPENVPPQLEYQ